MIIKSNRKLLVIVLAALLAGLFIPVHLSWGAPAFQTVPTMRPSATQRPPTAEPSRTNPAATNTSAPPNTPRPTSSSPTRTLPPTAIAPVDTGSAVVIQSSATSTPVLTSSATDVPPSQTPEQPTPSKTPQTPNPTTAAATPVESQTRPEATASNPEIQPAAQTESNQAGTNWIPLVILVLFLSAGGIWLAQKRQPGQRP